MGGWLSQVAGAPVVVENDGNVAALGEALRGAGVGFNPVFYVTLGSGVGGGLVVDGRIYHGAKPGEAEIGHVRLDRNGTIVEERCSGWAVDARIRELKVKEPGSLLAKLAGQTVGGEAKHLAAALQQGDCCRQDGSCRRWRRTWRLASRTPSTCSTRKSSSWAGGSRTWASRCGRASRAGCGSL